MNRLGALCSTFFDTQSLATSLLSAAPSRQWDMPQADVGNWGDGRRGCVRRCSAR